MSRLAETVETDLAATHSMQAACWRLGGVPIEHRTDNLSAATHDLAESRGRKFTERYRGTAS